MPMLKTILAAFSTRGTVYLAEIGDLSLDMQELIINNYFRSDRTPGSRLLCRTSRELLKRLKPRAIREDFYYLISPIRSGFPRCAAGNPKSSPSPMLF